MSPTARPGNENGGDLPGAVLDSSLGRERDRVSSLPDGPVRRGEPGGRPIPRWIVERSLPGRRLFFAAPLPAEACASVVELVEAVRERIRPGEPAADDRDRSVDGGGHGSVRGRAERSGAVGERTVRWVRMDGLHVTLRFLGPTLDERLPEVRSVLSAAADGVAPFTAVLSGGGAFPGPIRPRVLWLGFEEGVEGFAGLSRRVEESLTAAGWPPDERPFRPHLTLARADGIAAGTATAAALVELAAGWRVSWTVDRIGLFESITGGGPARYEPIAESRLVG